MRLRALDRIGCAGLFAHLALEGVFARFGESEFEGRSVHRTSPDIQRILDVFIRVGGQPCLGLRIPCVTGHAPCVAECTAASAGVAQALDGQGLR